MVKHTPFSLYEKLKETYIKYIKTGHPINDEDVKNERDDLLSSTLFQEPYIEYISVYSQKDGELEKVLNSSEDVELKEFLQFKDSLFPKEPKEYKFYTHQKEALNRENKHIIVTTGTGSGKTETFLLPVVRNLLEESKEWGNFAGLIPDNWRSFTATSPKYHREGEEDGRAAVRAMILYPLNALVDDQLIRLRKLFNSEEAIDFLKKKRKGNRIYFGRYTSDTPVAGDYSSPKKINEFRKALDKIKSYENATFTGRDNTEKSNLKAQEQGKYFLPSLNGAEMYSRWDMQEFPPDIMITNYSMLNIMLMRNIESSIFEKTKRWLQKNRNHKFQLIIDELHTYRGTAGTEIAYLIRLLLDRLGLTPDSDQLQIIASSASLGEDEEKCNKFLTEFFGVSDPKSFKIITGELEQPEKNVIYKANPTKYLEIEDPNELYKILKKDNAFEYIKSLLYNSQSKSFVAKSASQLAFEENKNKKYFEDLISAISKSSNDGIAEVPIRVHYFFKNLRGLWACSNPNCTEVDEKYRKNGHRNIGKLYSEPKTICKCGGRILELLICPTCGELFLGGFRNEDKKVENASAYLFPEAADLEKLPEYCNSDRTVSNYYLFTPNIYELSDDCIKPVKLKFKEGKKADVANEYIWEKAHYNSTNGFLNFNFIDNKDNNVMAYVAVKKNDIKGDAMPYICPKCNDNWARVKEVNTLPLIKSMNYGFQKINQILADSLLYEQNKDSKNGKNLILFTDSRQDAAKLSAGIEMDHYRDTLRQFAYFVTKKKSTSISNFIYLLNNINKLSSDEIVLYRKLKEILGSDGEILREFICNRNLCDDATIARATELINKPNIKYSDLVKEIYNNALQLGINPGGYTTNELGEYVWSDFFVYENNKFVRSTGNFEHEKFENKIRKMLIRELFKTIFHNHRGFEALGIGVVTFDRAKYSNLSNDEIELYDAIIRLYGEKGRYENSNAEEQDTPITMAKRYLKRVWGYNIKGNESIQFKNDLEHVMNKLYSMNVINKETQKLVSESLFILPYNENYYYICPSCKKVHLNRSRGICINQYCGTKLERVDQKLILDGNFYYDLSQKEPEKLTVEEATAQTDKSDQKNRQRRFQDLYIQQGNIKECALKDSIEILSVTTTMEAGVDIGALDSVMMANMPPQRFNYQQRVGRAGRRRKGLATALTVCRNRNHDEYYFKNPDRITNEPTPPPYLDTSSESIVERFIAKEVLRIAILESGLSDEYENGSKDVHGEFGSVAQWNKKYSDLFWEKALSQNDNVKKYDFYTEDIIKKWINNNQNNVKIYEIIEKLLQKTELQPKKENFFRYAKEILINDINNKIEQNWVDYTSLSELLANAGILPMFGFPTRERVLDTSRYNKSNISRDLDVALSQFAPKGETVKDKKIHISVGIKSTNLSKNNTKTYFICNSCSCVVEVNENELNKNYCPKCKNEGRVVKGVQPEGFFTLEYLNDEKKPLNYDGNFDFRPFAHKPQINQNEKLVLSETYNNCNYLKSEKLVQLVSINDNSGSLYEFKKCGDKDLWVSEDAIAVYDDKYKKIRLPLGDSEKNRDITYLRNLDSKKEEVALVSTKMTDVFLLKINKIPVNINLAIINDDGKANIYAKSAYYSLAFLLRSAVAKELDIDEKEIVVGLLPDKSEDDLPTAQVFLSDNLVNGAGYSRWVSQNSNLKDLLEQIDEKNEKFAKIYNNEHSKNCDSSCYLCMQDYANLHYHGLLNWRLGFDMVDILKNSKFIPSLKSERWFELALKALNNLYNFINVTNNSVEKLNIIEDKLQIVSSDGKIYQVIHPLESTLTTENICYINILDILKRPNIVQKCLKESSSKDAKPKIKVSFKSASSSSNVKLVKKQKNGNFVKIEIGGMISESAAEAFKRLINDGLGSLSEEEMQFYKKLLQATLEGCYESPQIDPAIKIKEKTFYPVLIWPYAKVALFNDLEEYNEAKKLDPCYDLYCTENDMNIQNFLNDIKIG